MTERFPFGPSTQQQQLLRQQQYLQERLRYRIEVAAPERADRVVVRVTVRRHVPNANVPIRAVSTPLRQPDSAFTVATPRR